jgi:hypothetical protein
MALLPLFATVHWRKDLGHSAVMVLVPTINIRIITHYIKLHGITPGLLPHCGTVVLQWVESL